MVLVNPYNYLRHLVFGDDLSYRITNMTPTYTVRKLMNSNFFWIGHGFGPRGTPLALSLS